MKQSGTDKTTNTGQDILLDIVQAGKNKAAQGQIENACDGEFLQQLLATRGRAFGSWVSQEMPSLIECSWFSSDEVTKLMKSAPGFGLLSSLDVPASSARFGTISTRVVGEEHSSLWRSHHAFFGSHTDTLTWH